MNFLKRILSLILLSSSFVYGADKEKLVNDAPLLETLYQEALLYRDEKVPNCDSSSSKREALSRFSELAQKGHIKAMHNFAMLCHKEHDYLTAYFWFKKAWDRGLEPSRNNIQRMIKDGKLRPSDIHISLYPTWNGAIYTKINPASHSESTDIFLEGLPSEIIAKIGSFMDAKSLIAFEQTSHKLNIDCEIAWESKAKTDIHPLDLKNLTSPYLGKDQKLKKLVYGYYLSNVGELLLRTLIPMYIDYGFRNLENSAKLGSERANILIIKNLNRLHSDMMRPNNYKVYGKTIIDRLSPLLKRFHNVPNNPNYYDLKYACWVDNFMSSSNRLMLEVQLIRLLRIGDQKAAMWFYSSTATPEENREPLSVLSVHAARAMELEQKNWVGINQKEKMWLLKILYWLNPIRDLNPQQPGMISAKHGYKHALSALGVMYAKQDNIDQAKYWYTLAALKGVPEALYNLGLYYSEEGNHELAKYWWTIGALNGDLNCKYNLSLLHKTLGELEAAKHWLTLLAHEGCYLAQKTLSEVYEEEGDMKLSQHWANRALNNSHKY